MTPPALVARPLSYEVRLGPAGPDIVLLERLGDGDLWTACQGPWYLTGDATESVRGPQNPAHLQGHWRYLPSLGRGVQQAQLWRVAHSLDAALKLLDAQVETAPAPEEYGPEDGGVRGRWRAPTQEEHMLLMEAGGSWLVVDGHLGFRSPQLVEDLSVLQQEERDCRNPKPPNPTRYFAVGLGAHVLGARPMWPWPGSPSWIHRDRGEGPVQDPVPSSSPEQRVSEALRAAVSTLRGMGQHHQHTGRVELELVVTDVAAALEGAADYLASQ